MQLSLRNRACGANVCASAAVDAGVGSDSIDFAFADGGSGTFVDASAAGNAIVRDNVSHCDKNLKSYVYVMYVGR